MLDATRLVQPSSALILPQSVRDQVWRRLAALPSTTSMWRGGAPIIGSMWRTLTPTIPTHLANKVTLSESSDNAPSLAVFSGRLYLSWRGTDGRLNLISSADGSTFKTKVTYNMQIRTSPTLVATPLFLEIGWEQPSAQAFIVIAQYATSHPATLSVVVTTTSSSSLPIALSFAGVAGYPALVVAWRTASDAHILLGFFGGAPHHYGDGQHRPNHSLWSRPRATVVQLDGYGWVSECQFEV